MMEGEADGKAGFRIDDLFLSGGHGGVEGDDDGENVIGKSFRSFGPEFVGNRRPRLGDASRDGGGGVGVASERDGGSDGGFDVGRLGDAGQRGERGRKRLHGARRVLAKLVEGWDWFTEVFSAAFAENRARFSASSSEDRFGDGSGGCDRFRMKMSRKAGDIREDQGFPD